MQGRREEGIEGGEGEREGEGKEGRKRKENANLHQRCIDLEIFTLKLLFSPCIV